MEEAKTIIQIELDNIHVLPNPKRVQKNGTVYISQPHAGRYVKAVIFEDEI